MCVQHNTMSEEDEVYKAFGRDTEAGKLIYNLYNSGASKRNAYKPNVKIRTKKTAGMGITPEQEHKLKQRAKYEEVKLKKSHGAPAPRLPQKMHKWHAIDSVQTRKSAARIEAENAVQQQQHDNLQLTKQTTDQNKQSKQRQTTNNI